MRTVCLAIAMSALVGFGLQAQDPTLVPPAASASSGNMDQTSAPAPTAFHIVNRGANHRVWQRETYQKLPNGRTITHTHSYTELASGMHYKDTNGNWAESRELIEPFANGAVARHGQYQVIFANNLNSAGAIDQQTPDGKRLRSNILGLAYYDASSGDTVMVAELQDAQGELISSNQVLYPNAFSGVKADVRYTYRIGTFEQDVILRQRPPSPESLGLNPATTEIEVLTEFLTPPELKAAHPHLVQSPEQDISWGAMRIGRGRAFDLGETNTIAAVERQYVSVGGRKILIEKVPLSKIKASLTRLPQQASRKTNGSFRMASGKLSLPNTPLARSERQPIRFASTEPSSKGYVLDYVEADSTSDDFTFQSDTTYYIAGDVYLDGTTTFEGGTVIKYNPAASETFIAMYGDINCNTDPYHPAIFTSQNDDTVGEAISDPGKSLYYWLTIAGISARDIAWHDLRIKYARYGFDCLNLHISDSQFIQCLYPIVQDYAYGGTLDATNLLIEDADSAITGEGFTAVAYQLTVSGCTNLTKDWAGGSSTLALTNSLLVNVQGAGDATVNSDYTSWVTDPFGTTLETVGGGNAYLPADSPYRGAGTANVDAGVLADMATHTTYPPMVYYSPDIYFSSNLNLHPQVQRDTNAFPDLGYHYAPLDYLCGPLFLTNCSVTIAPDTAVGFFGTNIYTYGFSPSTSVQLSAVGTPNHLVHLTAFNTVQEQQPANWVTPSYGLIAFFNGIPNSTVYFQFTDWTVIGQDDNFIHLQSLPTTWLADCQFHGGGMIDRTAIAMTNCLLERVNIDFEPEDDYPAVIRNNLFYGGTFGFGPWETNSVVMDNDFEQTTIPDWLGAYETSYYGGHNSFLTNCDQLDPLLSGDLVLAGPMAYQTGTLGYYYQPPDSPLIDAGSTTADQVGLYHYTTQTSQVPEANSVIDIGYHYVATDANGNPLDTNGDGIPDYIEDANGDGLFDNGEVVNWLTPVTGTSSLTFTNGFSISIFEPKPKSQIP